MENQLKKLKDNASAAANYGGWALCSLALTFFNLFELFFLMIAEGCALGAEYIEKRFHPEEYVTWRRPA